MERKKIIIIGICLLVIFGCVEYFIFSGNAISNSDKIDNQFKSCLQQQNITLYINSENSAEILKKMDLINDFEFSDYLEEIKIKNCFRNKQICLDNLIDKFPTWEINNEKIVRDLQFNELKEITGCKI